MENAENPIKSRPNLKFCIMLTKFSREVCRRLGHYVYRLIDPRTGQTFYVGKGKGNRVFDHVKDALRNNCQGQVYNNNVQDDISAKIQQIRDIHNAGLEVIMVIHRWGMDENSAYEVESALIDAYAGLANEQSGHDSDRGIANVETVQRVLGIKEFDDSNAEEKEFMIIKIKQEVLDARNGDIFETARRAWHIDSNKAQQYKYILVCLYGEVIAIYKNAKWYKSPTESPRWEFDAEEANSSTDSNIIERYLHKRLPRRYVKKGASYPILYQ